MTRHVGVLRLLSCALAAALLAGTGGASNDGMSEGDRPDRRRSGFDDMSPQTQAMQREDAQNPGMLWVKDGELEWGRAGGAAGRSCAGCHGDAKVSMRGVAARHPAWDAHLQRPLDLIGRIEACRQRHQQADALPLDSDVLLGLASYVAVQSRGLPVSPDDDPRLAPHLERGRQLYGQRIGQLDFSCAQCHDRHAGQRLAGSLIPQGHANGYPAYRLEWQALGGLQRRLRNCMTGVRAQPFDYGAPELVELELYLAQRAAGMAVEAPAVRP